MQSQIVGDADRLAVARGKNLGFSVVPSAPNRANRVDYVLGTQPARRGCDRLTGQKHSLLATNPATLLCDRGTSSTVDSSTHTASGEQVRVSSVHDRVVPGFSDIAKLHANLSWIANS